MNPNQYIALDQLIYVGDGGLSDEECEAFIDKFLDLVESLDDTAQTGGKYNFYKSAEDIPE